MFAALKFIFSPSFSIFLFIFSQFSFGWILLKLWLQVCDFEQFDHILQPCQIVCVFSPRLVDPLDSSGKLFLFLVFRHKFLGTPKITPKLSQSSPPPPCTAQTKLAGKWVGDDPPPWILRKKPLSPANLVNFGHFARKVFVPQMNQTMERGPAQQNAVCGSTMQWFQF